MYLVKKGAHCIVRKTRRELGDQDSNLNKQYQKLLCYRYTIPQDGRVGGKRMYRTGGAEVNCGGLGGEQLLMHVFAWANADGGVGTTGGTISGWGHTLMRLHFRRGFSCRQNCSLRIRICCRR
jgi:hypothetical protein